MLRRAAQLVGRRVALLPAADGSHGSLAALKHAETFVGLASTAEPRMGLTCLHQFFSSSSVNAATSSDRDSEAAGGAAAGAPAEPGAEPAQAAGDAGQQQQQQNGGSTEQEPPTLEGLQTELQAQRAAVGEQEAQAAEMKDKLLRTLADMENLRERSARQIDSNKQYAVQSFAKSLLDVADNLERAAGAVPEAALQPDSGMSAADVSKHLRTLLQGVQLTDKQLTSALKQHGVEKFGSLGEKFDPNMHSALFEMPDPSKEPGTVGAVTKNGYMLNGRVMRAADVGVVAAR
jgi:molecular chaperone GrpE